eukprot:scaffold174518_cov31-Tisochrysis_lutea.AAC.9
MPPRQRTGAAVEECGARPFGMGACRNATRQTCCRSLARPRANTRARMCSAECGEWAPHPHRTSVATKPPASCATRIATMVQSASARRQCASAGRAQQPPDPRSEHVAHATIAQSGRRVPSELNRTEYPHISSIQLNSASASGSRFIAKETFVHPALTRFRAPSEMSSGEGPTYAQDDAECTL